VGTNGSHARRKGLFNALNAEFFLGMNLMKIKKRRLKNNMEEINIESLVGTPEGDKLFKEASLVMLDMTKLYFQEIGINKSIAAFLVKALHFTVAAKDKNFNKGFTQLIKIVSYSLETIFQKELEKTKKKDLCLTTDKKITIPIKNIVRVSGILSINLTDKKSTYKPISVISLKDGNEVKVKESLTDILVILRSE
jgi:hypothetical protein